MTHKLGDAVVVNGSNAEGKVIGIGTYSRASTIYFVEHLNGQGDLVCVWYEKEQLTGIFGEVVG